MRALYCAHQPPPPPHTQHAGFVAAYATLGCPPGTVDAALLPEVPLIMDGPAALLIGLTGLRVSPHFDRPWRSISVATFWSKRWDLAAGEGGCCG